MNDKTKRATKHEQEHNRLGDYIDFVRNTIKRLAPTGQKRWTTPEALEEALTDSFYATTYKDLGYDTFDSFLRDPQFEDFWVVEKDPEGKDVVRIRLRREIAQYLKGVTDTIAALCKENNNEPITINRLNEALRGVNYAVTYTDLGYSSFEVFLTDAKRFSKFWNSEKTADYSILLAPAGVSIPRQTKERPHEQAKGAASNKKSEESVAASSEEGALNPDVVRIAQRVEGMGRLLFDAEGWVEIAKLEARVRASEQLQRMGFDSLQAFVDTYAEQLGWEVSLRGDEKTPSLRIREENLKATPRALNAHKEPAHMPRREHKEEREMHPHKEHGRHEAQSTAEHTGEKHRVVCGESKCGPISDSGALSIPEEALRSLKELLAPQYESQLKSVEPELYLRYHLTLYFYRLYRADALVVEDNSLLFNTGLSDRDRREIVAIVRDVRHLEGSEAYEVVSFRALRDAYHHDEEKEELPEGGKRFFMFADKTLTREQMLLDGLPPMEKSAFKDVLPSRIDALEMPQSVEALCTCAAPQNRQGNDALCEEVAAAYEAKRLSMVGEAPMLYPMAYDVAARMFYTLLPIELNGTKYCLSIAYEAGHYRPMALCTYEEALLRSAPLSWPQRSR